MFSRIGGLIALLFCVAEIFPSHALAANCKPPCPNTEASVTPTSVFPNPDDAIVRGESFTGQISTLNLSGDASQEIKLNFGFQIGSKTYTSVFVNENGLVSFGSPIGGTGFQQVGSLSELGVPVIAPFYADLMSNPDQSTSYRGNVVVQYGTADPYPNGGSFQASDFQDAVRITWYGLINQGQVGAGDLVFAQLLLAGDDKGTSSFHFSYGAPGSPGQAADGSIAGFSLGADAYQFTGPYTDGVPTYFEFDNGRLVGPLAAIPEPRTWIEILIGFALLGAAVRRRSSRATIPQPLLES